MLTHQGPALKRSVIVQLSSLRVQLVVLYSEVKTWAIFWPREGGTPVCIFLCLWRWLRRKNTFLHCRSRYMTQHTCGVGFLVSCEHPRTADHTFYIETASQQLHPVPRAIISITIQYDTRDAVLTCALKPTWVNLIYRTEPTAKKWKTKKLKSKKQIFFHVGLVTRAVHNASEYCDIHSTIFRYSGQHVLKVDSLASASVWKVRQVV